MWGKSATSPAPEVRPPGITPGLAAAKAARAQATNSLVAQIEKGPQVREMVNRVQEHGRINHFFELMEPTLPWTRRP